MVFVAEMGDKTQFLMIAMSSKHKIRDILIGVGAAILVLNALAIALGAVLGNILPTSAINLAAGIAFLCFAYMAVGGENEEECVDCKKKGSAIFTVFGTFFLAELGDKTQLTALTLAADSASGGFDMTKVLYVFLGASIALFAADVIGLLIGYAILYLTRSTAPVFIGSLLMMSGYLCGMAVFGAYIRDNIPSGMAGRFQGVRICSQVLIPGIIGPMIGKKILENAQTIIGNDGTASFVPNANIFLAAAIAAVFVLPLFFKEKHNDD